MVLGCVKLAVKTNQSRVQLLFIFDIEINTDDVMEAGVLEKNQYTSSRKESTQNGLYHMNYKWKITF